MADNKDKKVLNVPALRFPGFTEEWRKDTLQNVVTFSNGKAHENCVDENGSYILVNSKFVSTDGSVVKKVTSQLSPLSKSQFVMVMSDLPNGKALAKCYYIEEDNIYTLNQRICSFSAKNGNISRFLMYQINRNKYYLRFDDGINQTNLKKGEVLACPVFIPSVEEQKKIATFIHLLDERIATQNKIIEKLEALIKGLVVTHYSTTDHAIKVKIQELGKAYSTMVMSKEQLTNDGNPCIFYGELFTLYGCVIDEVKSRTSLEKASSTLSHGRDLLFPASTTVDALSLIAPSALMQKGIILGGDMFGIKVAEAYNPIYLSYYFNYIANKRLSKYAKGTTIIHLHYNEIANIAIELPSNEEQGKVVSIIQGYSTKLSIEETILKKLSELKLYLLNQMFI